MSGLFYFTLAMLCLAVLNHYFLSYRNLKIYDIQKRAIAVIFDSGRWQELEWLLNRQSYNSKIFDIRKHTFEDFYPELKDMK